MFSAAVPARLSKDQNNPDHDPREEKGLITAHTRKNLMPVKDRLRLLYELQAMTRKHYCPVVMTLKLEEELIMITERRAKLDQMWLYNGPWARLAVLLRLRLYIDVWKAVNVW